MPRARHPVLLRAYAGMCSETSLLKKPQVAVRAFWDAVATHEAAAKADGDLLQRHVRRREEGSRAGDGINQVLPRVLSAASPAAAATPVCTLGFTVCVSTLSASTD